MNCTEKLRYIIGTKQIIGKDILDEFLSIFSEKEIGKGEHLIKTEETVSKASFVCSGIFRTYYTDSNGKEINQAFLLQNDFIVSRLTPLSKSLVNIQAIEDCKILITDIKKINDLSEKHHSVAKFFLKIVSAYFDKNQDREIKLRIQDAKENYEYFLKEFPNLINQIPHYFIASHLQISSTHLSRIRREISLN
ncbi:MAG: hypothetical protein B7C24_09675 [Bacteroidetes bacterium 4572_77]|nr:MAG: hypothetical protein B7C24_09675 [Bacteroidetes bacterium 4572_77]